MLSAEPPSGQPAYSVSDRESGPDDLCGDGPLTFEADEGGRLDKIVAGCLDSLTRARVQALIEAGHVLVDGAPASGKADKIAPGQQVTVTVPPARPAAPEAQPIPLTIVYEDDDILVVNKQAGLVAHPGAGNPDGTLVNALLAHFGQSGASALSGIGGVARPGIVHRLDKDTSGLMVVAKNDQAHQGLSDQFADRTLSRTYLAVVRGALMPAKGRIETQIGRHPRNRLKMAVVVQSGKPAVTDYATHRIYRDRQGKPIASVAQCTLLTGRTHQIRVHMAHAGNPILGDPVYGASSQSLGTSARFSGIERQALHACAMRLRHPASGEMMAFECSIPADIRSLTDHLEAISRENT